MAALAADGSTDGDAGLPARVDAGWSARARATPSRSWWSRSWARTPSPTAPCTPPARKEGDKLITLRVDARRPPMKGETIHIQIDPAEVHVFSAESGRRVSGDAVGAPAVDASGGASRVSQT